MATPDPALDLLLFHLSGQTDGATGDKLPVSVWERAAQLADRHTVEMLFYARAKKGVNAAVMPAAVRQTLQQASHLGALKLARLYQELTAVLRRLSQDDIPVIVLKGAYLGQMVYQEPAFRPMNDIDLLVHQHDLSRVTAVMESRGFQLKNEAWGAKHLTFAADDGRPPVEIHWHITHPADPFTIDVAELWARAVPITLMGTPALAFSPEDLLLHLAVHLSFNHGFRFGLRPFCDIHETLDQFRGGIAWEAVIRRAHRWQIAHAVYLTLELTVDLLKTAVPDDVLQALKPDDFAPEMTLWAKNRVLGSESLPFVSSNFARMWEEGRLRDKAAVFLKCVLPPPEVQGEQSKTSPVAPARQLGKRLHRYGQAGWQLLRRDEAMCRDVNMKKWLASG